MTKFATYYVQCDVNSSLLCKHREIGFTEKISAKRQMSADGAADLRRRTGPSPRTRHGGEAIDAASEIRLRTKPAPRFPEHTTPCEWAECDGEFPAQTLHFTET